MNTLRRKHMTKSNITISDYVKMLTKFAALTMLAYAKADETEENFTEYIRCENCAGVFDHNSTAYEKIKCPYCHGTCTDASITITQNQAHGKRGFVIR